MTLPHPGRGQRMSWAFSPDGVRRACVAEKEEKERAIGRAREEGLVSAARTSGGMAVDCSCAVSSMRISNHGFDPCTTGLGPWRVNPAFV